MTYLMKSEPKNVKFARVYYSTTNDTYSLGNNTTVQIRIDTISGDASVVATVSNNSIVTGDKRYIIITKPCQIDNGTTSSQIQTTYYWKLNGASIDSQVKSINPGLGFASGPPSVYEEIGSVPVGFVEIEASAGDTLTLHVDTKFVAQPVTLPWNAFGVFIMEVDK